MTDNVQQDTAAPQSPPSKKRWYVVHAYSGMEKSVQRALQERIERAEMQDKFGRILVPSEDGLKNMAAPTPVTVRRYYPA